ncbi:hypothetical protein BD626DRAFT_497586 [Schizophyllum amplum]|uniref:F-box domain-containing protein n=1 Tax=Schizophyllum amplum TaxID=97359 RepID=A0A550CCH6_9AGAR|nr:hypothetical protein BD626DRAFT_497586 [Auriculariopsis ampla]
MVESLFARHREEIGLCDDCDRCIAVEFDEPVRGSENTILRTGRVLTAMEAERVAEAVAGTDSRLNDLENEIENLYSSVTLLQSAQESLLDLRALQQAYLAPIRTLPTELLSEIFKECCGSSSDLSQETCMPLLLSSVCKTWRDTMLGLPRIWASFLVPNTYFASTIAVMHHRLQTFLKYGGDLPLHEPLHYRVNQHGFRTGDVFSLLIPHSHRWTSLMIPQYLPDDPHVLFEDLEGQLLPRLLTLQGSSFHLYAGAKKGIFKSLPALRRVVLDDTGEGEEPLFVADLPWQQVEELATLRVSASYALEVLTLCPAIITWRHTGCEVLPPSTPSGFVSLPRLKELSMTLTDTMHVQLLDRLTTPALRRLSLTWTDQPFTITETGITSLLTRSACRPHQLELVYPPTMDASHLALLPELTGLTFIDSLRATDDTGALRFLPRLKVLHIGGFICFTAASMVDMVEARHSMGCALETFCLDLTGRASPDFEWDHSFAKRLEAAVTNLDLPGDRALRGFFSNWRL